MDGIKMKFGVRYIIVKATKNINVPTAMIYTQQDHDSNNH